jgi:Abnormal spindle-like microcephaly-assoc'd, ASPM-SPD-2-Hydin
VPAKGKSKVKKFLFQNTGNANLTFKEAKIEGADQTQFKIAKSCEKNQVLTEEAGSNSCNVEVEFTPTETKSEFKAELVVERVVEKGGYEAEPKVEADLKGSSETVSATLTPEEAEYGELEVGSESTAKTFVLKNTSKVPLEIEKGPELSEEDSNQFTLESNTCPAPKETLAGEASCEVKVKFTPTEQDFHQTEVRVLAGGKELAANINGIGTQAQLAVKEGVGTVESEELDFPQGQQVLSQSEPQPVTIENVGTAVLRMEAIEVEGENAQDFKIEDEAGCKKVKLVLKATCQFKVVFEPHGAGERNAVLLLKSTNGGKPHVELTGGGKFYSEVFFKEEQVNFNEVEVGGERTETISLKNTGETPVKIKENIAIGGANSNQFQIRRETCAEYESEKKTLAPKTSCMIKVTFKPTSEGEKTARVQAVTDVGGPKEASLKGIGTKAGGPTLPGASVTHQPLQLAPIAFTRKPLASPGRFRVARAHTSARGVASARKHRAAKQPPLGTTFSYWLNRGATVTITMQRLLYGRVERVRVRGHGRRAGKTRLICGKVTRRDRSARRCYLPRNIVRIVRVSHAGLNRVSFTGRVGRVALVPGYYHAVFEATDSNGKRAKLTYAAFRVVR